VITLRQWKQFCFNLRLVMRFTDLYIDGQKIVNISPTNVIHTRPKGQSLMVTGKRYSFEESVNANHTLHNLYGRVVTSPLSLSKLQKIQKVFLKGERA